MRWLYGLKNELNELDRIIDKKHVQEKRKQFEKHISTFNIVKDYIKKKNLLLYGGLALNLSLPPSFRFYDEYDLPDYDFFSSSAKEHAKELADIFSASGYEYVEVKPGLHSETYKVFVEFLPVADITDIPNNLFTTMMRISREEKHIIEKNNPDIDINIAPLSFLRLALHIELSRPDGYIERWPKIYERMHKFYKTYPLLYDSECKDVFMRDTNERFQILKRACMNFVKLNNYPMLGAEAIKMYISKGWSRVHDRDIFDGNMPAMEIVSSEYKVTAESVMKDLRALLANGESLDMRIHSPLNKSEFLPKHIIISYVDGKKAARPLLTIYKSQACYSYKTLNGYNILTIDSMLSFLYAHLFTDRIYIKKDKIKCCINILLNLQHSHKNSFDKFWQRFELKCYGIQPQMQDMLKARWARKGFNYRPNNNMTGEKVKTS
jgi:hypothetical protein